MKGVVVVAVTALLLVATCADATLSKADRAALKYKDGPRNISVIEAGLVRENVRSIDILKWHKMYHDKKSINFDGEVLGYVTPWNNHGYDIAKTFAKKLSIVSPVWLQLQPAAQGSAKIGGLQDLDRKWMAEVKKSDHNNTLIMPRLILHEWSRSSLEWLLNNARSRQGVVDKIVRLCEEYKFDGLVFEILSQVSRADYKQALVFIEEIGTAMHQKDKRFILVVPPSGRPNALSKTDFQRLIPFVDRFSLMTYDYSTGGSSGPNAPIRWVEECVLHLAPNATHRSKILLGLNFYGMDFTRKEGKPILGREVIGQLERNTPTIMWDATAKEHSFMYYSDTDHQVFYPTLQSIKVRLDLAESLGTGISIWDIGQGLDYFWDLF